VAFNSPRYRRLMATAALLATANARANGTSDSIDVPMRTVAMVVGMALLGGLVSWITKVRAGQIAGWSLMHLVGELCTSAFAGFTCYLLCDQFGVSLRLTVCFVGIAGHMGTRAIAVFEKFAERRWGDLGGPSKE
jgi:hypothetical protein